MLDKAIWDEVDAVVKSAKTIVPHVVARHREKGILTWALLRHMEDEVLAALEATEVHSDSTLRMICSSPVCRYPKDERPVSFAGHTVIPTIFGQIDKAWKFVH